MKYILLFSCCFVLVARARAFELPMHPSFETNSISASAQQQLRALKAGMTRAQLNEHFYLDGGLQAPAVSRYFLVGYKAANRKVIMVEVAFRPAGMDDATFINANKRANWFKTHAGFQPNDVVLAIGTPYMADIAAD